MNRSFLVVSFVLLVLLGLGTAARAEGEAPESNYCQLRSEACLDGCSRYSVQLWGMTFPTPRTALCVGECTVAYVGCIMLRFREGV